MAPTAPVDTTLGAISLVQTRPDSITLHLIEDHELEAFMNVSRPYSLAAATTSLGGFLGLLPTVLNAFEHRASGITTTELVSVVVCAFCLATASVAGTYAVRGLIDANRALRRIRARPTFPC
jgi:hypothetical protein